jgi:hypothetical protein
MWDNTAWKVKSTSKGYYFSSNAVTNNQPPDEKLSTSLALWGRLSIDPVGFLNMDLYESDTNGVCVLVETLALSYRAGSGFDFVAGFQASSETSLKTGLLKISGKSDDEGGSVLSGKLETVGGYTEETFFREETDFVAFGVTIKGKLAKQLGCTLQDR